MEALNINVVVSTTANCSELQNYVLMMRLKERKKEYYNITQRVGT